MRLFTGLDLPAEVIGNLHHLLDQLRPSARIKWSPPENLHITTRFIGEWPEPRLAELQAALAGIPAQPAIPVHVLKLGFFPNPHAPRVFWAGVEAPPELAALAAQTDRALDTLGLSPEGRPFRPHLTLARIKDPMPLQKLREQIAALPSLEFGSFTATRFYLYLSQRTSAGSIYSKLAEYPLSAAVS